MSKQKVYPRRIYRNPRELIKDLQSIFANRKTARLAMDGGVIQATFRERLMLVVTQVNGCRYCSYFHARVALANGIRGEELRSLLAGMIPSECPENELLALTYAQHWAASNAQPDTKLTAQLVAEYGKEKTDAIDMILRIIRIGNLLGNTLDYWLFRFSSGRCGVRAEERSDSG